MIALAERRLKLYLAATKFLLERSGLPQDNLSLYHLEKILYYIYFYIQQQSFTTNNKIYIHYCSV